MKDVFIINPYSGKKEQYALMQQIKENFQGKRIIIEKTKNPGQKKRFTFLFAEAMVRFMK